MTTARDLRFGLYDHDNWAELNPPSSGFVINLHTNESYLVTYYHSIHCLDSVRKLIARTGNLTALDEEHAGHCLDYLRQILTCHADDTMEPMVDGEALDGAKVRVVQGWGTEHVCRDWTQLRAFVDKNFESWREWP